MTKIEWGAAGAKEYETGLDRGVLYPFASGTVVNPGVPWEGLVSVTENVSGGEVESYYYDGVKYMDWILYEDFQATLEAFNAPREFGVCDGRKEVALGLFATRQRRHPFHLCYRTGVGNDLGEESNKLHVVYNCMATPSEVAHRTRSNEVSLEVKTWTLYGRPPKAGVYSGASYKPTAHLILDLDKLSGSQITAIENRLYGTVSTTPQVPSQQEFVTFLNTGAWT